MKLSRIERQPRPATTDDLMRIPLLRICADARLCDLASESCCRAYQKGDEVDVPIDKDGPTVLGIVFGELRLLFRSADGVEMPAIERFDQGDAFDPRNGEWSLPDETVLLVLTTRAVVAYLPLHLFEASIGKPAAALFARCHDWIEELSGLACTGMHRRPEDRIRCTMYRDARHSANGWVEYTHEHLAARSNTQRWKVTKVTGQLERDAILRRERRPRRTMVNDWARLVEG